MHTKGLFSLRLDPQHLIPREACAVHKHHITSTTLPNTFIHSCLASTLNL